MSTTLPLVVTVLYLVECIVLILWHFNTATGVSLSLYMDGVTYVE